MSTIADNSTVNYPLELGKAQQEIAHLRRREADIIEVAVGRKLLVKCAGPEKNLGYRLPEDVQLGGLA